MIKECTYCGHEFNANRSDTKYCSDSCRSQAYIARKSEKIAGVPQTANSRRTNQSNEVSLTKGQIGQMLNMLKSNPHILNNLMLEKDKSGDLKSELSENKMKLFYLEEKLKDREKEIADLKAEKNILSNEVSNNEKSKLDKLVEGIMDHPETLPQTIAACQGFISSFSGTQSAIGQHPDQDEWSKDDLDLERQLDILQAFYPDLALNKLLAKINAVIKDKKTLIDQFILTNTRINK